VSENTSVPADISWRVSRTCDSGACVGVARLGDVIMIRNTNNPAVPANEFSVGEWRQFLAGVKLGDFDELA
jgi:hypothetical protein